MFEIGEKASKIPDCIRFDSGGTNFHVDFIISECIKGFKTKKTLKLEFGLEDLRKEIAKKERKNGKNIDYKNVLITNGVMGGMYLVSSSILNRDDKIIANKACFEGYKWIADCCGAELKQVDLSDIQKIKSEINPQKTKLIYFTNPDNPTGKIYKEKEMREIADIAKDNNLLIISDEVFNEILYDNRKYISIYKFAPENTIIVNSFSKNYFMSGLRIGYLIAPQYIIEPLSRHLVAMTGAVNTFGQYCALCILRMKNKNLKQYKQYKNELEKRRNSCAQKCEEMGWEMQKIEAGYSAFPDIKMDGEKFMEKLLEHGVAVIPGKVFGKDNK
ncbi:MAG TPA: pyridoxal phosphate-dependent aminotransferase, partial [Candidatus Aenigmarchaeota archaeon]|nr:pyridoxal phosphate-dependent aminotransferase [Candidatus Aenigmarchaeota archaeon]